MAFTLICTLITIIGPSLIEEITNTISIGLFGTINIDYIIKIATILASLYVLSFIFNYLHSYIMAYVTRNISKSLRKNISRKINYLPLSYLDSNTHGDILSRITNDVDTFSHSLDQSITTVITSSLLFIGSLTMMFIKNWILALASIGASVLGFIFVFIIIKASQKHFIAQQYSLGELNGHIEEIYSGHNIVKAYNAENESTKEFNAINLTLYKLDKIMNGDIQDILDAGKQTDNFLLHGLPAEGHPERTVHGFR